MLTIRQIIIGFLILGCLGSSIAVVATPAPMKYVVQWEKTYGDQHDNEAKAFIQTLDGGFALVGNTNATGTDSRDIWLVKTTADGTSSWNAVYGGNASDRAVDIIQTADEGFLIAGDTNSYGAGSDDCWLVKVSSTGVLQWNYTYGGSNIDFTESVVTTSTGYLLAATTLSFGSGNSDIWLVNLNSSGGIVWNQTYGGAGFEELLAVASTTDGYLLVGQSTISSWVLRVATNGTLVSNTTLFQNIAKDYHPNQIIVTNNSGFAVVGTIDLPDEKMAHIFVFNSSNHVIVNNTYGGADDDYGRYLIIAEDGTFLLTGDSQSFGSELDVFIMKISSNGKYIEYSQPFGKDDQDTMSGIVQLADGSLVFFGSTMSSSHGFRDYWLFKVAWQNEPYPSSKNKTGSTFLPLIAGIGVLVAIRSRKTFNNH